MKTNNKHLSMSGAQKGLSTKVQQSKVVKKASEGLIGCPGCGLMSFSSYQKEKA